MTDPAAIYDTISEEADRVLIGNDETIEMLTISLLTKGHLLLEGVPGVAKTTIANVFARATGLDPTRIQMTPDILPADITGTHMYREATGEFELQKGPVFANVVIADEINRATPKTQSALLEAMQERTVTIEGETLELPSPFMVIATQNPIEMEGTFELPEAQRDRFQLKLTVDLPEREQEQALIRRFDDTPDISPAEIESVVTAEEIHAARKVATETYIDERVQGYILDVIERTRSTPRLEYGASPRATLAFLNATKARAAIHGREYVIPDDVKALAHPILVHRLVLSTDAELSDISPADIIDDILDSVDAPSSEQLADERTPSSASAGKSVTTGDQ